jgi:Ras GTPase-activating-like protein IQGAP2/3
MSYPSYSPRTRLGHSTASPSPLRQTSTASTGSTSSNGTNILPSRSSTQSSNASNGFGPTLGHRRGQSEATGLLRARPESYYGSSEETDTANTYASMRKALRPLKQVPQTTPTADNSLRPSPPGSPSPPRSHSRSRSQSVENFRFQTHDGSISPPSKPRPLSIAVSRADSVRAPTRDHTARPLSAHLDRPQLQTLGKSSTGHLRTLSKFAESATDDDFTIKSPEQEVVGLHGRRRLQRTDREKKTQSSWASRNWMDQQRQFLQAYEYLCHIGEAKEWMEDIIETDLPPAVELEEALRNGVTLAEIVQSIKGHPLRIFRDPKLQYRHSNNYAHFFNFLTEVELPDLFQFELIDLYEKKNVPKVIYCIHALSWLLFRKGIVDFRIGNLVGKLQFEDHELEATQKGLDKSGVSMPNFSGMQANFAVEPEPEPVESEQDRIDRELGEHQPVILDLQAQVRGALVRIRLGNMMQGFWDHEHTIVDLQSRIRGDWARQIAYYRLDMRRFAVNLQRYARGYMIRSRAKGEEDYWRDSTPQVLKVQNLFRGRKARAQVQYTKSEMQQHEAGIRQFQAAIRGALERRRVFDRYEQTHDTEPATIHMQAMVRGALLRLKVDREWAELNELQPQIAELQAASRAMMLRRSLQADQDNLRQHESIVTMLQAAARGILARKSNVQMQEQLGDTGVTWSDLQSKVRGDLVRISLKQLQDALEAEAPLVTDIQSKIRGDATRKTLKESHDALEAEEAQITHLQSKVRGDVARKSLQEFREALQAEAPLITDLQAIARGSHVRSDVADTLAQLSGQEEAVLTLQAYMRGFLTRQKHVADLQALEAEVPAITDLQSACRGFVQRQRTYDTLCELNAQEPEITQLQAQVRGILQRMYIGLQLAEVEEHEEAIAELQALARGVLVRQQFVEKQQFYKENMEKVIKIQSFIRGRQQGEAYKSLTSGKNPPVSTVKNFVHLLNDSDIDFDEEIGKASFTHSLLRN